MQFHDKAINSNVHSIVDGNCNGKYLMRCKRFRQKLVIPVILMKTK